MEFGSGPSCQLSQEPWWWASKNLRPLIKAPNREERKQSALLPQSSSERQVVKRDQQEKSSDLRTVPRPRALPITVNA